jgi:excinuclease ABC subunit B
MKAVIDESSRRRKVQEEYNTKHEITPKTIYKSMEDVLISTSVADAFKEIRKEGYRRKGDFLDDLDKATALDMLKKEMLRAAENLEFEKAAKLRDEIEFLREKIES